MSVLSAARALGEESGWSLSNLTIQKTLYVAQLMHLGRTGRPVFRDQFEAWEFGPVVPNLYREIKRFRSSPVQDVFSVASLAAGSTERDAIIDAYLATKHMTAAQLVNYTHKVGGAWDLHFRDGHRGIVIPTEAIQREWAEASHPSEDDFSWAQATADHLAENPSEHLGYTDERAFRARLFRESVN